MGCNTMNFWYKSEYMSICKPCSELQLLYIVKKHMLYLRLIECTVLWLYPEWHAADCTHTLGPPLHCFYTPIHWVMRIFKFISGCYLNVSQPSLCFSFSLWCVLRPEKEPQFKFIYFNHMNLAEKSTIHMRKTASVCLTSVHPDLMKILGDINCDFARYWFNGVDNDSSILANNTKIIFNLSL